MSAIIGLLTMSHSPSWDMRQPTEGVGGQWATAVRMAAARMAAMQPSALVVFGPDHLRNFFYDVMPAFCIGVETVRGFGDFESPSGPLPGAPDLARAIADGVMAAGFDPAISFNMSVDHGVTQPYALIDPALTTPIIPIMINSTGADYPSLRRCHEFGRAVGQAIRAHNGDERVGMVGSGGMSHFLPSLSPDSPTMAPELRDYVINGRMRADQFNREREASSYARRAAKGVGPVNSEWDRWFLAQVMADDLDPVLDMTSAELEAVAGVGAHELRNWLAALGAWGAAIDEQAYEPVPLWVTGMGCLSAFAA